MKVYSINTGLFKLDGGAMHGVVPKSMWNKVNPADDNNMCSWAMRCMLLDTGDKRILIDTGMGSKQDAKFYSFFYPHGSDTLKGSLHQLGYQDSDITDVFLTHLHFDHCGGAIERIQDTLQPAFPNATYWSEESHWHSANHPNIREKASFLKENILPIQESGKLKFYNEQTSSYFDGILEVLTVFGHTEAMMLPLVNYNGRKILFCADLVPSMAHVSMPWVMSYDMQPLHTLNEKAQYFNRAVQEDWVLFFEHDLHTECATLEQTDRGIKVKESFALRDLK